MKLQEYRNHPRAHCVADQSTVYNVVDLVNAALKVEDAYQQIRQVLSGEDEDYGFHHPGIKSALILVHIAPEMVGCLIGKAGKNVKMIKEDTGANIRVDGEPIYAISQYLLCFLHFSEPQY